MRGARGGKMALGTGERGGVGRAAVGRLQREGAVADAADLTEGDTLASPYRESRLLPSDATPVMEPVRADLAKPDILVNPAGIETEKTMAGKTLEDWSRSFAVSGTGTSVVLRHALPPLRNAAPDGASTAIIDFGSYDGIIADPGLAACCAAMGAAQRPSISFNAGPARCT